MQCFCPWYKGRPKRMNFLKISKKGGGGVGTFPDQKSILHFFHILRVNLTVKWWQNLPNAQMSICPQKFAIYLFWKRRASLLSLVHVWWRYILQKVGRRVSTLSTFEQLTNLGLKIDNRFALVRPAHIFQLSHLTLGWYLTTICHFTKTLHLYGRIFMFSTSLYLTKFPYLPQIQYSISLGPHIWQDCQIGLTWQ